MQNLKFVFIGLFLLGLLASCEEEEIDTEKPVIDLSIEGAFPLACDTLYFGETFTLKMLFTDNEGLGSYSVDIHNNFDHHSHSTEVEQCDLWPVKVPVNPYLFIKDYELPTATSHEVNAEFILPESNEAGSYEAGDYHFFVSLTDQSGWSSQIGLNIKIMHRNP